MYLDDVIRFCLPMIFVGSGHCTFEAYSFKFTKDAEMDMDNDLGSGVMQKVAKGVKSRKSGEPIRVIYDENMPKDLLKRIPTLTDNLWSRSFRLRCVGGA